VVTRRKVLHAARVVLEHVHTQLRVLQHTLTPVGHRAHWKCASLKENPMLTSLSNLLKPERIGIHLEVVIRIVLLKALRHLGREA
jgi:hypothetical protein